MPTGSTLPQGSEDAATGSARCVFHTTAPVAASSAYTVSFSVAVMTRPPTINGCAYTSPSSAGLVHCCLTAAADAGPSAANPLRPLSWKYVGHPCACAGLGAVVVVDGAAPEIAVV